jgi:hypothetical protein
MYGAVTLDTTFEDIPMLCGNSVSLCVGAGVTVAVSLRAPDNYDFRRLAQVVKQVGAARRQRVLCMSRQHVTGNGARKPRCAVPSCPLPPLAGGGDARGPGSTAAARLMECGGSAA